MSCERCQALAMFGSRMDCPRFCYEHREPGMFDVVRLHCYNPLCVRGRQAYSLYCLVHAVCEHDGCNKRPHYSHDLKQHRRCVDHV
jgi:hypothetical protein